MTPASVNPVITQHIATIRAKIELRNFIVTKRARAVFAAAVLGVKSKMIKLTTCADVYTQTL